MSINSFFKDVLGANLRNTRWSWGALDPRSDHVFLRVWDEHLQDVDGEKCVSVLNKHGSTRSPGHSERERHLERLRQGAKGFGVVCSPRDRDAVGSWSIAEFDRDRLLQFGRLIEDESHVYATVQGQVPTEALARHRTAHSALLPDVAAILRTGDPTTREALAQARIGQGAFRRQVLEVWGGRCCVTGSMVEDALRASHIKPWRDSTDDERLDPRNGFPLAATLDALFDAGLISFSDSGRMLRSDRVSSQEWERLGVTQSALRSPPADGTKGYLAHHRARVFQDKAP